MAVPVYSPLLHEHWVRPVSPTCVNACVRARVSFHFGFSHWKKYAAFINRSESFSTPQWFQAQLGKLNIIKAQGKGCTFLKKKKRVRESMGERERSGEGARYRSRHAAMHVQYSMPRHRASTERRLGGGRAGREIGRQGLVAAITEIHLRLARYATFYVGTFLSTLWSLQASRSNEHVTQ